MRKYLRGPAGWEAEITPLSFDEFTALGLWRGGNDMAYAAWLRHNRLHELDSFNEETLQESVLVLVPEAGRTFEFSPDGETWVPYTDALTLQIQCDTLGHVPERAWAREQYRLAPFGSNRC